MRAIIIDDEEFAITALQSDLERYCRSVQVVATCRSGKEGIQAISRHAPDLIFLDIDMPLMSGLEMLAQLGDMTGFSVIFITAYAEYAVKAFRLSAVDFLLKPVDKDELLEAVNKAAASAQNRDQGGRITNLISNARQPAASHKIALPNRDGYEFVAVKDIAFCKADGAYTHMVMADSRKILLSKPLGEVEDMLPAELFERIHHSTIININYVRHFIRKDGASVVMESGDDLSISKSKKDRLMQRLGITVS